MVRLKVFLNVILGFYPTFFSFLDCLQKFVDVEELDETERFFCNNCKNKQRSTKKFWIRRLPNVSSNSFIIDFSLEGESLPHPES